MRHCLEKNPEQRFHSAHDLAFDLEALSVTSATGAAAMAAQTGRLAPRVPRLGLAALAAGAIAAGVVAGHFLWRPREAFGADVPAADVSPGQSWNRPLCARRRSVVYGASFEGQPLEIYTTRPEGPESTPTGIKNANLMSVSASSDLAVSVRDRFLAGPAGIGTLATVPLGGGAPRAIAEFVEYADWTPDGKLALVRFLDGKNRLELPLGKVLYSSDHGFRSLRVSPRGDRFAVYERAPVGRSLAVVDLAGKARTLVPGGLQGQGLAWSPSGDEVWFDDRGDHGQFFLKAVDLSGRVRTLASTPVGLIVHDVARDGRCLVERYGSRPGMLGLVAGETRERDFPGSTARGSSTCPMTAGCFSSTSPETPRAQSAPLSPQDRRLARGEPRHRRRLRHLSRRQVGARAPPDSRKAIVLQPTGPGAPISIDVGLFESVGNTSFFPDGKRLLLAATEPGKKPMLYVQDIPAGKPRAITSKRYGFAPNSISPDGLWVAAYGEWTEDVFLLPVTGGEPRSVPGTKDVDLVRWSADGKSIFAVETGSIPARVVRVDVATGRREIWKTLAPPELAGLIDISPVMMTPDGKAYVYGYEARRSPTSTSSKG